MFKVVRVLLLGGMLGKVLGILRELIFAWLFGTGPVASAFRLAQSAFLIPLHGFVSESINGAFTPQYAAYRKTDPLRAKALFSGLYTVLLIISVAVGIVLFVGAGFWVKALAPGFDVERQTIAVTMLRVLALALPVYVASGLFASVDLAMGRGGISASRASIQSLGLIFGTALASYFNEPYLIAVGFVGAFVFLFFSGKRVLLRDGLTLKPVVLSTPEVKCVMIGLFNVFKVLIWIPIAFQVNGVIERRVASLVSLDAVAAVDYARFVTDTIIVLVAMPFGLAGLSTMANMNEETFNKTRLYAFRALLYIGIPLSALLSVNAKFLVSVIFERGAFGASSVLITSQILSGMAIGVWGQLIGYAGAKFMSARGRNVGALVASVSGVSCSVFILLFCSSFLGSYVLGVAAAVQGVIFGLFVLLKMRVVQDMRSEILSLIIIAAAYFVLTALVGFGEVFGGVLNLAFGVFFWLFFLFVLPWHRAPIMSLISYVLTRARSV